MHILYECKYHCYKNGKYECPHKEKHKDNRKKDWDDIIHQKCPVDVRRDNNGNPICYEIEDRKEN